MNYRRLGSTQLQVSEIAFGGASISGEGGGYGFGDIAKSDAIKMIDFTLDHGINLFDTAPIYGFGQSEKVLGEALRKKRSQCIIVNKCGITWHANKRVDLDNSPLTVVKMLDQSLRDLKTDYIDIYMVHWPDPRTPIAETLEALLKEKNKGKFRFIGLCNTNLDELEQAQSVCKIDVLQSEFNLFNKKEYTDLYTQIETQDMGFMGWGTFDKGILTRKVVEGRVYDKSDCRSGAQWWKQRNNKLRMSIVEQICSEFKLPHLSAMALNFVLNHDKLSCALIGARNIDQWKDVLQIPRESIRVNLMERWDELWSGAQN